MDITIGLIKLLNIRFITSSPLVWYSELFYFDFAEVKQKYLRINYVKLLYHIVKV